MQVNPEDSPQDIYVTWSNPPMTDFENVSVFKILTSILKWFIDSLEIVEK